MSGAGSGWTIAGFGQLSPVLPLMDRNFPSSNLSLVPPLDELIEMVQYYKNPELKKMMASLGLDCPRVGPGPYGPRSGPDAG